ncbi:MAG: DUF3455 domain-containing protein [Acidimicrobiia bacterium]
MSIIGTTGRRLAAVAAAGAAVTGLLAGTTYLAAAASPHSPPDVPAAIAVPAGHKLASMGSAVGFQVYACQAGGWVLQAPQAVLLERGHKPFALHYGGPTWTALDGSSVTATRAGSAPAPIPGAIPWLLLEATPTNAPAGGTFSDVAFIQRVNTSGGVAPTDGCDAASVGATAPVFYTADYFFYRAA